MRRVLGRSFVAALATPAYWSAAASAATSVPGLVTVRVEGTSQTLLAQTPVLTEAGAFHPASDPVVAHTCPGTSAAEALEPATGATWSGTYFTSFGDYEVDSILGKAHPIGPTDGSYYLLKQRLPAGRYVLDAEATGNAGNVDRQVAGRSWIVFRVG